MNFPRLFLFFLLLLLLAFLPQLHAGVGDNNPTGIAGMFNGQVTTGGSYDPYTGNAHRVVTDITVAGAVGEYALGLTRTSNSRDTAGTAFGSPGAWRHDYQWLLQNSDPVSTFNNPPTHYEPPSYRVIFPDGRIETFIDTGGADPNFRTTAGVRERFKQLTALTDLCYLLLPDGGKVEFEATLVVEMAPPNSGDPNMYWNEYQAKAIIDPYGLRTTFTYDTNEPPRLSKVTEPANGRYLQFYYRMTPGQTHIVDHVTEFIAGVARRSVQYKYTTSAFPPGTTQYTALTSVEYYGVPATWTARYTYVGPPNCGNVNGVPLLKTADDPMYAGPMHKIGYVYKTGLNADGTTPGCGQILSENYYNGTTVGAAVSTLTVTSSTTRTETRPFGETRTFIYTGPGYVGGEGYLAWVSDFQGHQYSQGYDENMYVNSVFDFNRIETNFTRYSISGNVTQIQYPLTPNDTVPPQTVRPTVNYSYGWAGCADPNNLDWSVPYYVCTAKDEAGHVTQFLRNTNKRITRINYPDGGYETFTYNSFGQVLSHRMTTGGTETFTYDTRGLKQTYRNPSNGIGNPTARYQYDAWDRLSGVTDALGSITSFEYNLRGQVTKTTLPTDPVDGGRHTIVNAYNPNGDGTLISVTDQLGHVTSYTYDDYRRLTSVTTPARYTGDTTHTTSLFYDASGTLPDYKYADSKVTYMMLPSGKRIKASYDDNRRKISVITGFNTADAATTGYTYDNVGNLTSVTDPLGHITTTVYDERNRPSSVSDAVGRVTTFKYDLWGRKYSETRPNGQVTTFNSYDAMNRLLQLNVNQFPEPVAVTKYTYYTPADGTNAPVGLLKTMQDPRLVALNSIYNYKYEYDTTGRKTKLTCPPDAGGVQRTEQFTYDTAGRLQTFKNRNDKTQTFTFDALNRMSYFTWNDGITPRVDFGYDVGSRLVTINNANATISRAYFNDNLLSSETETITGGVARTVSYTYDEDGNRDSLQFPGYSFTYDYTGRNQLKKIVSGATTLATFGYDLNGNLSFRDLDNSTYTDYAYDQLDRVTDVRHYLNGTTRTFTYGNDTNSNNRKWTKRDDGNGDVFGYDLANQVAAVKLDIPNPDTTSVGAQTIIYDANGNRTSFSPYGTTDTYTINNLNQYSSRNGINAAYDANGNLTTGVDGSTYTYDAQNRLLSATKNGITMSFAYDGLNRQVSRWIDNGQKTYSAWDGWDLVQEYQEDQGAGVITAAYLYGPAGLVKELLSNNYYYQDGSGSTSHLADGDGALLEWYRYDLQGTPIIYDSLNNQLSTSNYGIRHLFTGQQWYSELGLYDLRNRFYSPDIGRFLQPDPIGFWGDRSNLYRYCGNNPVNWRDPSGLAVDTYKPLEAQQDTSAGYFNGDPWGSDNDLKEFDVDYPGGEGWFNVDITDGGPPPMGRSRNFGGYASDRISGGGGSGDGRGRGGRTLANSPATNLLGKFLQTFNAQGGWNETANALDAFANFEVSLLLFGEGQVMWGVGRFALGPTVLASFSGRISSTVLRSPMIAYRYSGGSAPLVGSYLTNARTVSQLSSAQSASVALKLPAYNTAESVRTFMIPAGTRVYSGGVAGGADTATQIFVEDATVLVPYP